MRPDGPVARRGDYLIERCPHQTALAFVREHHYARGGSRTSVHAHCFRRVSDGVLVGAALWMPPTRVAAESVAGDRWQGVLALSRLAVADSEPQNATGLFLARAMRLALADTRWHTLLTYADTRHGHTGVIYRATGWEYLGVMRGRPAWIDPATGRQVAAQATRTRTVAEMRERGYLRLEPTPKHKFVYAPR